MPKDERLSIKINDCSIDSWGFSVIHPPPLLLIECPIDKFILPTPFTDPREVLSIVIPISLASLVDLKVSSCARCASFSANTLLATKHLHSAGAQWRVTGVIAVMKSHNVNPFPWSGLRNIMISIFCGTLLSTVRGTALLGGKAPRPQVSAWRDTNYIVAQSCSFLFY